MLIDVGMEKVTNLATTHGKHSLCILSEGTHVAIGRSGWSHWDLQ